MANIIGMGLRASEFFWTLLILALTGNMIASALGGNPSIVNYVMFTAVISMLSLLFLIPATISDGFALHAMLPIVADALNVLFTFIAGVALAAQLGANNCSNGSYTSSNLVTSGSTDNMKRCREAQASTAFLWFLFFSYVASLVFSFLNRGNVGGSGFNMRVGSRGIRRGPSMSQASRA